MQDYNVNNGEVYSVKEAKAQYGGAIKAKQKAVDKELKKYANVAKQVKKTAIAANKAEAKFNVKQTRSTERKLNSAWNFSSWRGQSTWAPGQCFSGCVLFSENFLANQGENEYNRTSYQAK